MSLPSTHELKSVIVDILSTAQNDGRLDQLTVRIVRQELATWFKLEEDVLNGETYKCFIKATVHATVDSLQNASSAESPPRKVVKMEKEKSGSKSKTASSRKPRAKARVHSDEELSEAIHESGSDTPPPKKGSPQSKSSKPAKPSKPAKKPQSETKYKSKATIESSDDEATGTLTFTPSPKKEQKSTKLPSPKKKQLQKAKKIDSDVEMAFAEGPGPSGPIPKPMLMTESPRAPISKAKEPTRDPMESELSSVVDEPPKKKYKKLEKESVKPQKDEKTKRGRKKEALSKDEETINKLKGIVIACGVRKVWKKEFEGLDKPSQQIKRLHSILNDLGMTPRYSIEKAKAIREERELAQELKDVQEFDKATKRRGKSHRNSSGTDEPADLEESDADVPVRKKSNARASIMAFLQDQSDEE